VRTHLLDRAKVYILAGDEVVVSKAGKKTHGLGRFYSSLAQRRIAGVSFLALSLVDVEKRRAYPLLVEQRRPVTQEKASKPAEKRGRGRPKGSKNHAKAAPALSAELTQLSQAEAKQLPLHQQKVDLARLGLEHSTTFSPLFEEKVITLKTGAATDAP
jgi:putative transposase